MKQGFWIIASEEPKLPSCREAPLLQVSLPYKRGALALLRRGSRTPAITFLKRAPLCSSELPSPLLLKGRAPLWLPSEGKSEGSLLNSSNCQAQPKHKLQL